MRNTCKGIFYLLPSREKFIKSISNDYADCPEEEIPDRMVTLIENSDKITAYLQNFLKDRDHLNLP